MNLWFQELMKMVFLLIYFFQLIVTKPVSVKMNKRQSVRQLRWGPNSFERACFSLSYIVNTRQATPLLVQGAKPQEFPLSVFFPLPSIPVSVLHSHLLRYTSWIHWQEYWTSKNLFLYPIIHSSQDCLPYISIFLTHWNPPGPQRFCVLAQNTGMNLEKKFWK